MAGSQVSWEGLPFARQPWISETPQECWDSRLGILYLVYVVLAIKPRTSSMLSKDCTNCAIPQPSIDLHRQASWSCTWEKWMEGQTSWWRDLLVTFLHPWDLCELASVGEHFSKILSHLISYEIVANCFRQLWLSWGVDILSVSLSFHLPSTHISPDTYSYTFITDIHNCFSHKQYHSTLEEHSRA